MVKPIHAWFGLSRASYLVLPRLALQSMPDEWQRQLVYLLDEAELMGLETPSDYVMQRRDEKGHFVTDPWSDYKYGDIAKINGKPLK